MKNLERQLCHPEDIELNKAVAITNRLSYAPNLMPIDNYFNIDTFSTFLRNLVMEPDGVFCLITAVDRGMSRKIMIEACDEYLKDFIIINPGNGFDTAMCSLYVKLRGTTLTTHPFGRYPNLANPTDTLPGGCSADIPSTPQLIAANNMAAHMALLYLTNILDGYEVPDEMNGNVRLGKIVSMGQALLVK